MVFSVAGATDIPVWDFGFALVQMIGYQGQGYRRNDGRICTSLSRNIFRKITPAVISMIVVPFCSLVPAVIIAHTVVGPIGWVIGNGIADVVYSGLTSSFWSLICCSIWINLCTNRYDWSSSYD